MENRRLNKKKVFFVFVVFIILSITCGVSAYYLQEPNIASQAVIEEKQEQVSEEELERRKILQNKGEYNNPKYDSKYITKINNIDLENIKIKNEYQFVFIADLQASIKDNTLKNEYLKQFLTDRYNLFVSQNPNGIGQEEIFDKIVEYTNNMDADALLLGGDIIDCPADSNFNLLRKELNKNLKVNYLYTLGNHDAVFEEEKLKEDEKKYMPFFEELMDDVDVSYLEYEDLVVLAINDGAGKFSEEAVGKVKKVLEKNKPTIVMTHIPISTQYIAEEEAKIRDRLSVIGEGGIEPDENTQKVIDLITSEEYNVFYILAGHIHYALKDNLNEQIIEEISAPAFQGAINVIKINNQEENKK